MLAIHPDLGIETFIRPFGQEWSMGLFDKLMFWKKGENDDILGARPTGLEQPTGLDLGPMGPQQPSGYAEPRLGDIGGYGSPQQPQAFQDMRQQQQPQQADLTSQKLDVISGKIDIVKACLDNLNQRLEKLEKIAEAGRKGQW